MKSRSGPPPFFIVGSPRSGTKLLRSILTAHSEVAIPQETFYFSQIVPQAKRYLKGHNISNKDGFLDVMRASLNLEPSIPLIMEDVLKREKSWTIGSLFSDVLTRYVHSLGKVRWGEKTPSHLWYWKTINNLFPGCKFIVMVRDGRDAVCSAAEMPWSTGNVFVDAFRWKIDIRKGYRLLSKLGPERAIQISYEELVAEPGETTKRVCDHLSLAYEPSMLTDFQDTKDMTLHKADGRLRDEDERIFATSIRRYERDLSPETISYLNSLLHPELRGLGGIESPVDLPSWATSMGIYIYSVCMYGYVYGRRLIKREARKVA